jgi:hypothetical protein
MRTAGLLIAAALVLTPAATLAHDCGKAGKVDLAGKTFTGDAVWSDGDTYRMTITFNADCTLRYGYNDQVYDDARWVQDGDAFSYQVNDGYALYLGRINGRSVIQGSAANKVGSSANFSFKLDR